MTNWHQLVLLAAFASASCVTGHVVERANRARETPDAVAFDDPDPRVQAAAVEGCARHPTQLCEERVLKDLARRTDDPLVGKYLNAFIKLRCDSSFATKTLTLLTTESLSDLRRHVAACPSPDLLSALYFGKAGDDGRDLALRFFRQASTSEETKSEPSEELAFLTWALKVKGPSADARRRVAEVRDNNARERRRAEESAKMELTRQARERLARADCSVASLSSNLQSLVATREVGECWAKRAREFVEQDRLDEARSSISEASERGVDTADIDAELELRAAAAEHLAKQKREWEAKWGEFAAWRRRPANRSVVQFAARLARSRKTIARLKELHKAEAARNDEANREDSVFSDPIFPETSGSFAFVKILSQNEGEALFSASDGLFVLRLSPGDSFNAYPGQSVRMTIHSRGERMSMTTGARLPVFMSGSSPARRRFIKGFKPNRAKERSLLQRLEAESRATLALVKSATTPLDGEDGVALLKAARNSRLEGNEDGDRRLLILDGDTPVYCIELGQSCSVGTGETVTEQTLDDG